ncbi:YunG family protein [Bacillus paralicheniformis]|uniref:YunG family protein n=1 Tax=Bacillus paralicheniformis TaxID=1648923 RepID=UPI00128B2B10|nr:hypothetical protein [Bacillus paralicheniformis]MPQ23957.1 hypothetical protein [Bacillus paralicheniformis]
MIITLGRSEQIMNALYKSWSSDSSSKWSQDNPAKGQCGVTALIVNDLLGGGEGWHFYNFINGKRYDLTVSQFKEDILYRGVPSNRNDAFSDSNEKLYNYLKQSVIKHLSFSNSKLH